MKKKSILAIAALLTFGQVAWADGTPTKHFSGTFNSGQTNEQDGSKGKPYHIASIEDLNHLAEDVNSGTDYYGVYFQLTDDLDYKDKTFTPIGTGDETSNGTPFKGIFDGAGKTISNITYTDNKRVGVGLFGYIYSPAEIRNVNLKICSFTGNSGVGAIVGNSSGYSPYFGIYDCTVASDVSVTATTDDEENAPALYAGGIIGYCGYLLVSNCTSAAAVSGGSCVGGIAGLLYEGTIENCFYTGNSDFSDDSKGVITGDRGNPDIADKEGTIKLTLYNDDSDAKKNADRLSYYDGIENVDVTLSGRTLSKKNEWNTLCLPFSMDATQIAAGSLNGATIKELDAENSNLATNGTLTLTFSDVSSITAGKPYIVKWASGKNISDPVFYGVTINAMAPTAVTFTNNVNAYGDCHFVGQYSPFSITDGNKNEIIMLGSSSKLGYSKNERTLKCFRAHFYVPANGGGTPARAFVMDFGDGETTEIIGATADQRSASATYTLDGRRINDLPTQKGMYIQNGRKVIIK